ncbi:hypothetical protein [Clostridium perfringens]|nr:hypothetical protein [Clostridium perfringens]
MNNNKIIPIIKVNRLRGDINMNDVFELEKLIYCFIEKEEQD